MVSMHFPASWDGVTVGLLTAIIPCGVAVRLWHVDLTSIDWSPNPTPPTGMDGAAMLWGDGSLGDDQNDAARVQAFKELSSTPKYVIGFEEPDCSTPGSAAMTVDASTSLTVPVLVQSLSRLSVNALCRIEC